MKSDYNRIREERFGSMPDPSVAQLRAEVDRLDDEVVRLKDSRQAIWNTLTERVSRLSHLQVAMDRISVLHEPDDREFPYCPTCDDPWPCRTAQVIRRYQ